MVLVKYMIKFIVPDPFRHTVPTEFTSVPFPVKALKLLLHDLQFNGEAAPFTLDKVLNHMADLQDDDDVSLPFSTTGVQY